MSIASGLTLLVNTKEAIRRAIEAKGVAVDTSEPFSAYAGRIGEIQTPVHYTVYGVAIDSQETDPSLAVTYTDDAVGKTPGVADEGWDAIFPTIRPCLLNDGVVSYLDPADYAKLADGSAADVTTGSAGDVMVEIPRLGYQITSDDRYTYVKVTDDPAREGFAYYAHNRDDERAALYVGAYHCCETGGALRSLSGKTPKRSASFETFKASAEARGTGYGLIGFYQMVLLQCLFLIRFKSINSQTALGVGLTSGTVKQTGTLDAAGMFSGSTSATAHVKAFGIEDLWGNVRCLVDGIKTDDQCALWLAADPANADSYVQAGQYTADAGWLMRPAGTNELGFMPGEIATEESYFCDYVAFNPSCVAHYGGYYLDGNTAGLFRTAVSSASTASSSTVGTRLMYL